ncbi:MAG: hypothetical protein IT337_02545 [Thermomicrobiales bacterium]|nr:hypothetical protein [Thermomicrobiales bacterium]
MVDQMLGGLFGGPDSDRVRSQAQDFVTRYNQGQPHEGYDNQEVVNQFRNAARNAQPQDMENAATEAFSRMPREQRREYRRAMRQRGYRQFQGDDNDDPRVLAQQTQGFMKEQAEQHPGGIEGFLGNLFGHGNANQPATQQTQAQPQEQGSILDNTAVKAAMAGMAAFALKQMMDKQHRS